MTYQEVDARQGDADREFSYWTQRGCDPDVVNAMLPALVASDETTRWKGEQFLDQYGRVGHGPNNSAARDATEWAKEYLAEMMEEGDFTGDPMFVTGNRYVPSESDPALHEAWDEMNPAVGPYADHRNHEVIEEADLLNGLDRGETTFSEDPDSGVITAHYNH